MKFTPNLSVNRGMIFILFILTSFYSCNSYFSKKKETLNLREGQINILESKIKGKNTIKKVIIEEGVHYLEKTINITQNFSIEGKGANLTKLKSKGETIFNIQAIPYHKQETFNNLISGSSIINFKERLPSNIKKGDVITVEAADKMPELNGTYNKYFTSKIKKIEGTQIVLEDSISMDIDVTKGRIKVSFCKPLIINISNLTLESQDVLYLLEIDKCANVFIDNVTFTTTDKKEQGFFKNNTIGTSGIALYRTHHALVTNCTFNNIWYGLMAHKGCQKVFLKDSKAYESRHINNNGLGTVYFSVSNCVTEKCFGGFDSHRSGLTTIIEDCKDLNPTSLSRFRGRRNIVRRSSFEGGVEMTNDESLNNLCPNELFSRIEKSKVFGATSVFWGHNQTITDCSFFMPISTKKLSGKFSMENVKIECIENSNKKLPYELLVLGTPFNLKDKLVCDLKNISITGPYSTVLKNAPKNCALGLYIPLSENMVVNIDKLQISNVYKGLVLYGGKESLEAYSSMALKEVIIENCTYGVFQLKYKKELKAKDVQIRGCIISDNEPLYLEERDIKKENKKN